MERCSKTKFTELNDAMREYHEVFGPGIWPPGSASIPREPVVSDFYEPSNEQHNRELAFITLSVDQAFFK